MSKISTKFLKKEQVAKDTFAFYFEKPFDFIPGQYTTIFLGKDNRDFTIASSTNNKEYFFIVTKKGVSDFKKNLFALQPQAKVVVSYPAGGFVLSHDDSLQIFLAGGIGMTPFYSMIASNPQIKKQIVFLVSFSKQSDIVYYDALQKVQQENKNIRIIFTLSSSHPAPDAGFRSWTSKYDNFETGRISEELIRKYVPNITHAKFMIAGGEKMVEDTEALLLAMGIPQEQIRIDIFTGYE